MNLLLRQLYYFLFPWKKPRGPLCTAYMQRIRQVMADAGFFNPTMEAIGKLVLLDSEIRGDTNLDDEETDFLLGEIALPGWFPVMKWGGRS